MAMPRKAKDVKAKVGLTSSSPLVKVASFAAPASKWEIAPAPVPVYEESHQAEEAGKSVIDDPEIISEGDKGEDSAVFADDEVDDLDKQSNNCLTSYNEEIIKDWDFNWESVRV
jgi:hypothetical protein